MDRKIKIIFLINDLKIGGAEKQFIYLANNLSDYDFEVMVLTIWNRGELIGELSHKVLYKTLDFNGKIIPLKNIKKIIDDFSPDIINSVLFYSNILLKILRPFINKDIKKVYSQVSSDKWRNPVINFMERIITKGDFYYTVNSESSSQIIQRKLGINKDKIVRLNNMISGEFNKPIFKNDGKIGFLGRYHYAKGSDIFIGFLKKNKIDNFLCYFAGDSFLIEDLDNSKIFWNSLNIEYFFKKIDILVLTSRWEGMPNSIIEGAFFGKVVIIPEKLFKKELLKGFILEYKDENHLYDIINRLKNDMEFYKKSAEKLQNFIYENHSSEKVIQKYKYFYKELIGEQR